MQRLNCYIIDDEQPAINVLLKFVDKIPFLNLIGSHTDALAALSVFNDTKIDLLFLDIQMPDISGVKYFQLLDEKPMVIFTTAFEKYALEGYELDIVDYLLKPIAFDRFLKSANKALRLDGLNRNKERTEETLLIKTGYKTKKLILEEILYIEGLKDYVKIHTVDGMHLTRLNLKGIESRLSSDNFVRIHRSFIVAINKITTFQKSKIYIGAIEIPVGEHYRDDFIKKLG